MWIPLVLCHEQIERKKWLNRRGMDHQSKRFQAPLTFFCEFGGIMTFDVFYEGLCHTVCYLLPLDNDDDDDHDDCGLLGCYFRFQFVRGLQTSNEWTQLFLHFHYTNSCTRSTCSYKQHFLLTSSIFFTFFRISSVRYSLICLLLSLEVE